MSDPLTVGHSRGTYHVCLCVHDQLCVPRLMCIVCGHVCAMYGVSMRCTIVFGSRAFKCEDDALFNICSQQHVGILG